MNECYVIILHPVSIFPSNFASHLCSCFVGAAASHPPRLTSAASLHALDETGPLPVQRLAAGCQISTGSTLLVGPCHLDIFVEGAQGLLRTALPQFATQSVDRFADGG